MSAPVWDDKALIEVYQWREEGRTWSRIGAQGGEEGDAAKVRFSKARSSGRLARVLEGGPATVLKETPIGDSMTWTEGNGTADLQSRSPRIRTLETLLESAKVDLTRWYVVTHTIKSWDMGAKGPDGNILTEELWAIRATFRAVQVPPPWGRVLYVRAGAGRSASWHVGLGGRNGRRGLGLRDNGTSD